MHSLNKNVYSLAIGLSALAGCVDAIGFLSLGGYFISFMSGNSTRLAAGIASGNLSSVAIVGGILTLFVIGTMVGVLVRHRAKTGAGIVTVLACVTALLFGAAISHEMGWDFLTIAFMTLAMGAENAVFLRNGDVVIGLTYMTGTLVKLGQRLANALLGGPKYAWAPYLLLWMGLIIGGVVGALLFYSLGLQSLWIAALWAAGLMITARILGRYMGDLD
jgi:uncharacterized membrane protein YoaK (UPF0700 family)